VTMWVQTSFASELGLVMRREGDFEVELQDWGRKEPVLENEKRKGKGWGEEQGRASASSSLALRNRSERGIVDRQFLLFRFCCE
jgi:hypothetical protein